MMMFIFNLSEPFQGGNKAGIYCSFVREENAPHTSTACSAVSQLKVISSIGSLIWAYAPSTNR